MFFFKFVVRYVTGVLFINSVGGFPISKTVLMPSNALIQRHKKLSNLSEERNLFSCCFVFKLNTNQEIEIPLLGKFISSKGNFSLDSVTGILTNGKGVKSDANIIFSSCNPVFRSIETIRCLYTLFYEKVKTSRDSTEADKNQVMLLTTLGDRLDQDSSRVMRLTDSETKALYVLQHKYVIDNIIDALCEQINKIASDPQITSIEFHGCTTRDMCPLCFTNMNIIQYLCNIPGEYRDGEFSFLRYLKYILTQPIKKAFNQSHINAVTGKTYAIQNCPTKMFISSTREDKANLNFSGEDEGEQDNYLHQFRILNTTSSANAFVSTVKRREDKETQTNTKTGEKIDKETQKDIITDAEIFEEKENIESEEPLQEADTEDQEKVQRSMCPSCDII